MRKGSAWRCHVWMCTFSSDPLEADRDAARQVTIKGQIGGVMKRREWHPAHALGPASVTFVQDESDASTLEAEAKEYKQALAASV
jgi:hypothetical protein